MKILVEATFFKFQFITGIERHFFLQLEIFDSSKIFDTIYIVVTNPLPENYLNLQTPYEIIIIDSNSDSSWSNVYSNYKFNILYSTFEPPALLPDISIPIFYVLHDPGRYLFPEMMEYGVLDKHISRFERYIQRDNFYVITVSESSKKDIIKLFPKLQRKIFVVYNFLSSSLLKLKSSSKPHVTGLVANKFYLIIGRYMPTKNTLIMVKSFQNRPSVFERFSLVILGRKGWYDEFDQYVEGARDKNIKLLDFVFDEHLIWLYENCYALINASLYEGFGLPLIEAAALGCKRIMCSDISVFREILPNATAFFETNNQKKIEQVLFEKEHMENDFSNDVRLKFSKENSVSQFLDIINLILMHK